MKVYQSRATSLFHEKQADVPKGEKFDAIDFDFSASPKSDFIIFLNRIGYSPDGSEPVTMVGMNIDDELPVDRYVREQAEKPEPAAHQQRAPRTADGVVEWMLDEATPAEVENVFTAIGARFHEMRKASA